MQSKDKEPIKDKEQTLLTEIHAWAMQLVAKHPSGDDTLSKSVRVSTGTREEFDEGIFSTIVIENKGSVTVIDLSQTMYGDVLPEDREKNERFLLNETTDGRYFLETSGLVASGAEAALFREDVTEEEYEQSLRDDENTLDARLHTASIEDAERLANIMEIAHLGNEYTSAVMFVDDIDRIISDWREQVEERQGDEGRPYPKMSTLAIVRDAFRKFLKKK